MKNLLILLTAILIFTGCKDQKSNNMETSSEAYLGEKQNSESVVKYPIITFNKMEHDFGAIAQEEVTAVFKFENTGVSPLVISSIKAKCGCTVPNNWPKNAIAPGGKGEFTVNFNPRNKKGRVRQPITITSNSKAVNQTVTITADVLTNTPFSGH